MLCPEPVALVPVEFSMKMTLRGQSGRIRRTEDEETIEIQQCIVNGITRHRYWYHRCSEMFETELYVAGDCTTETIVPSLARGFPERPSPPGKLQTKGRYACVHRSTKTTEE